MSKSSECYPKAKKYIQEALPPSQFRVERQAEQIWRWLRHGYFQSLLAEVYFEQYPGDLYHDQYRYPLINLDDVLMGLILHDALGKPFISSNLGAWYLSRSRLTNQELASMVEHPMIGSMISYYHDSLYQTKLPQAAQDIVRYHHEKLNGSGPLKLSGKQIPHIVQCATVFDQILSRCEIKPYHEKRYSLGGAYKEVNNRREIEFNPSVLDNLMSLFLENRHLFQPGLKWLGEYNPTI